MVNFDRPELKMTNEPLSKESEEALLLFASIAKHNIAKISRIVSTEEGLALGDAKKHVINTALAVAIVETFMIMGVAASPEATQECVTLVIQHIDKKRK